MRCGRSVSGARAPCTRTCCAGGRLWRARARASVCVCVCERERASRFLRNNLGGTLLTLNPVHPLPC